MTELKVTFAAEYGEEPREEIVVPNARDFITLERKFKHSLTVGVPSYEQSVFLAYNCLLRQGKLAAGQTFEQFIDSVAEFDSVDDDENAEGADDAPLA